jgi:serine/threonine protein kinase
MEYISENLKEYLEKTDFNLAETTRICIQIVLAVMNLHESKIVHRDLKPANILVDLSSDEAVVNIIDYSDSYYMREELAEGSIPKLGCTMPYSPI